MRRIVYLFYLLALLFSPVLLHAQAGGQGGNLFNFTYGGGFCNGGCAVTPIANGAVVKGMVLDTDEERGGPIVAGYANVNGQNDFFLIEHVYTGNLSQRFASNGRLIIDLGSPDDEAWGIVRQPDDKYILAGFSGNDFALVRVSHMGEMDNTFNGNGIVKTNLGGTDKGLCVALQADGKILVAGTTDATGNGDFAIVRYNPNGSLDAGFGGGDGIVTTDIGSNTLDGAFSIKVQPDGKILLAGITEGSTYDIAVVRYNSNGTLDAGFDGDGKLTTHVGAVDYAARVDVQLDGKIIVGGYTGSGTFPGTNRNFLLIRYNSNGSLDTTFDGDGIVTTDFGDDEPAYAMTLQNDGKTLLAGVLGTNFLVARYTSTGALDPDYHFDGWNTYTLGDTNPNGVPADMTIQTIEGTDAGTVHIIFVVGNANELEGLVSAGGDAPLLTLVPAGASLPLNLLSFNAQKQSSNILLQWQTEREQNIAGFDIQRSSDGKNFKAVGYTQPITTTGMVKKNYSFTDNNPLSSVNYYRLVIKDLDGSSTYSKILAIKNNSKGQNLEIFPNPLPVSGGILQVQLPAGLRGRTSLQITDAIGRTVKTVALETGGNSMATSVDVGSLSRGVYVVRVKSGNNISLTTRFIRN